MLESAMTDSGGMQIESRLVSVIRGGTIAALASSASDGPLVCAIFYILLGGPRFAFKSRRGSEHMRSLSKNPRSSLVIYSHASTYESKVGVQIKGRVREASDSGEMTAIVESYSARFEGSGKKLPNIATLLDSTTESTFFVFDADSYRLIDESSDGNWTMDRFAPFIEVSKSLAK
jgi:nitroimidazol reductase NimA-like FMN-containing flavoprotein (pyridoxamine 5'-phosphate oxidase superfamily)